MKYSYLNICTLFKIIKSFILRETINTKESFVNDFLRSVIGDNTTSPAYIGTRAYEKITNFTLNISDVDTCNVSALQSLAQSVGYDEISTSTNNWPSDFKRILDLLSISKKKLFGYRRPQTDNFDKKGFTDNPKYGINLGDLIGVKTDGKYDCSTYIVSAGTKIVAKQIYDSRFFLIEPMYLEDNSSGTYPLSTYNINWGWGLHSEESGTSKFDLHEYYEFYEYKTLNKDKIVSAYETEIQNGTFITAVSGYEPINNIINWESPDTTVDHVQSLDDWDLNASKIIERELRYRLGILNKA